jgi:hypothetical protein
LEQYEVLLTIGDTLLYCLGGRNESLDNSNSDTICIYNIKKNIWTTIIPISYPSGLDWAGGYNYMTVANGVIYCVSTSRVDHKLRIFISLNGGVDWTSYTGSSQSSQEPCITVLGNYVYILGGDYGFAPNTFFSFNILTHAFSQLQQSPLIARGYCNTLFAWGDTLLQVNGKVDTVMAKYDIGSGTWTTCQIPLKITNSPFTIIKYPSQTFIATNLPSFIPIWDYRFSPPLDAPTLISPSDSSSGVPTNVTFTWNSVENATRYRLRLSLSGVAFDTVINGISVTINNLDTSSRYYWTVFAGNDGGYVSSALSRYFITSSVTAVTGKAFKASQFSLSQSYPNPFNPSTTISFNLPSKSFVSLKIYDLIGREVATLVSEKLSAGNHSRQWNAANMASGIYFYRLQADLFAETKKLVLLK